MTAVGMAVVFIHGTETVIIIRNVVQLQLRRPPFPYMFRFLCAEPFVSVGTDKVGQVVLLQRLCMAVATSPERSCDVEASAAVVYIKIIGKCVPILIHARKPVLKANAIALRLFQCNAYDSLCRGCIACAGILYNVDKLDLVGTKARQFFYVLDLPAVYIHFGIATPQHLHGGIALGFQ